MQAGMVDMDFQAFWLTKRGNCPDEWEDAFQADASAGRFALADGATDSVYAQSWGQCLVDHFVATG
ncbi:MAG: hypothetical protein ACC628_21660, partial [Pirellulaceae bacterium]